MANDAQLIFDGTATDVITQTATITDGYVVGGDAEFDNSASGDRWPLARAVLQITDTFGGAPDGTVDLYMVRGDVEGTNDGTALGYAALADSDAQTTPEYAEYMGSWVTNVDEAFRASITISLVGVTAAKFYIQNNSGQTLVYSASAITVSIEGFSYTPSA